ncbi:MAG: hypothetical protein JWO91_2926 [Acidobacteriaceae bacterium]|nr:hypothetical protein [Acidobacteriaceae bacterium]
MESPANHTAHSGRELRPAPLNRRRSVRQKVHIPAYANLNGSRSGMVLDLNEIVDISEDGMCVQTSTPLTPNRSLPISLDLAETKAFIHTAGLVVWTDKSGRAGLKFPELPPQSRHQLQEWLFANAIAAFINHGEPTHKDVKHVGPSNGDLSHRAPSHGNATPSEFKFSALLPDLKQMLSVAGDTASAKDAASASSVPPLEFENVVHLDYTSLLTGLAAVQKEVESLGADQEKALQLIVGCALTFTRATGAAVALSSQFIKSEGETDIDREPSPGAMICTAVAGCDAPPVGSHLQVGSGFSGECVRSRTLLSCEDAETDSRVDRETCRALGIRSMIASPVLLNDAAIGLLEVFSPNAHAFDSNDRTAIERLAKIIAGTVAQSKDSSSLASAAPLLFGQNIFPQTGSLDEESSVEPSFESFNDKYSKALLIAAVVTLLIVLFWFFASNSKSRSGSNGSQPSANSAEATSPAASSPGSKQNALPVNDIEGLRRLAMQGDPMAQYALGVRYATGDEVKQDDTQALALFTKAAEEGSVPAQATLGAYYWAGRGVPQDLKKAYFWAVLARAGGDVGSKYRTAVLASRLSRSQIIAARQEAEDWIKAHQLSAKK